MGGLTISVASLLTREFYAWQRTQPVFAQIQWIQVLMISEAACKRGYRDHDHLYKMKHNAFMDYQACGVRLLSGWPIFPVWVASNFTY
jgi:hypothetical protein